jgi:streptogramin lyase
MLGFSKHQEHAAEETAPGKLATKIVIASEDANGAVRAREVSEHLARELSPGAEVSSEVWRFNFLRHEDVRNVAAASITDADIVVVSARDDGELPPHVKIWIEDWLPVPRERPTALLALVDRHPGTPPTLPSVSSYLLRIARRTGMNFYLEAGEGCKPDIVLVATDGQESEADTSRSMDRIAPEGSIFQSRRLIPETAEIRLNNYAHTTAIQ